MYTTSTINNLLLIEIDNFLTEQEVFDLLEPRKFNFRKAISHYPKYYRNNDRLVEDNEHLSSYLLHKLNRSTSIIKKIADPIVSINERIRFCRYQKGQEFSLHQDGIYYPNDKSQSKYTFLLYLNDNDSFTGGETHFYISKTDDTPTKTIIPKKGKLLIFDHLLWHNGAKVISGNKFILRSDIIIKKNRDNTHHKGYIWNLLKTNKNTFLSAGRDTKIKLWNTNLELLNSIRIHTKSVLKIARITTSVFISCSRDFTIKTWNLTGEIISTLILEEMILNIIVLQKNQKIIAVGTSGKMYVLGFNLEILKIIKVHNDWIWDVSNIEENIIISCSEDGTIHRTDLFLEETECIYTDHKPIFCLYIENNDTIIAGSKSGTLIHLSLSTMKSTSIKVHNDIIRSIIKNENQVISCGEDNRVMVTNFQSKKVNEIFRTDNFIQDIIRIDNIIYAAGYEGIIHIINV